MKPADRSIWLLLVFMVLAVLALPVSTAHAGKNADGALIVHTNDAVNYTFFNADYCGVDFDDPGTCENAGTRTDKDENTAAVIWFLAAFPDSSNPGVSVVYFGVDHNITPTQGYIGPCGFCGPEGSLEVPDDGWPTDTDAGNSVAFGDPIVDDLLFPFYWFAVYGFEGADFGTGINPTGEYAAFVDDNSPGVLDEITSFGTVRWYTEGSNECPTGGGEGDGDGGGEEEGEGEDPVDDPPDGGEGVENEEWFDGDGQSRWVANCIIARLRADLPMPPREPSAQLGIAAFDALGTQLGMVSVQRVLRMKDSMCSRFPVGSRFVRIQLESGADEKAAAQQFAQLTEVVWSEPDYAFPTELYDERTDLQWYLLTSEQSSCLPVGLESCCVGCDIGIETAWEYSRGSSSVGIGFYDLGADMQHPDLFDAWMRNPDPRENLGVEAVELCDSTLGGDINGADEDSNGVADDVLLGYHIDPRYPPSWKHEAGDSDHGTAVAGLLGAITKNNLGVASVAGGDSALGVTGVRLIQFSRPAAAYILMPQSKIYGTFYYARAYGARVYSTSVGIRDSTGIRDAVSELADSMLFVASAGNFNGTPFANAFARFPGVMGVGGYQCQYGGRWIVPGGLFGSDYGRELSVLGPTNWVAESEVPQMVMASTGPTTPNDEYQCTPESLDGIVCFGGTSAAAPIVASTAALLFSYSDEQDPPLDLTARQVRKIIERTAEDILCDPSLSASCGCDNPAAYCADSLLGWDRFTGYGRVDAGRAFTLPVAALDPLAPYADFVIWGGEVRFSWETIHLPSNVGTPDHLRLDYYIPEDALGWHEIADDIPWTTDTYTWIADSLLVGDHRYFRLGIVDSLGRILNADYRRFRVEETTDVASEPSPLSAVQGVWPNPSATGARIKYVLKVPAEVMIEVFDVAGRRVRMVTEGGQPAGVTTVDWDGRDDHGHPVTSGIYFIRVALGSQVRTVRLTRIR